MYQLLQDDSINGASSLVFPKQYSASPPAERCSVMPECQYAFQEILTNMTTHQINIIMYVINDSHVKSNRADRLMSENDHKEAEKQNVSTCRQWSERGDNYIVLLITIDTDVVVILVGVFHDLVQCHPGTQLWHMKALPLLPHQFNLSRTWGGKRSCFALFHASRFQM